MADAVASVSLRADLRDLTKALTSATGLTEGAAQKMVIALEKSFQRAEKASKAASAAMVKAANQEQAAWLAEVDAMNAAIDAEAERVKAVERATAAEKARLATLESIPESIRKAAALEIQSTAALKAKADAIGITTQRYLALEQAELDAAQATAATAKTVTTAKVSYGNLGAQLADIGKGLASGVSPLTIATQQGEQLVGALTQMGTVGMVVAGVLAGLTATVLAGMTAWKAYYEEENAAIEVALAHREAQDELQTVLDDTKATLIQIQVETKGLTELQGELQTNSVNAMEAYATATEKTRARLAALHAEEQSTTGQIERSIADFAEKGKEYYGVLPIMAYAVDAWTTSTEEAAAETQALTEDLGKAAEVVKTNRQAHDELSVAQDAAAGASKRHKSAIDEEKKALEAWNDALKAENDTAEKNAKTYRDALDAIDKMSFGLKKNKTDVENLADAYHANLEAIKASEMEALAVVSGNADAEYTARHAALLKSIEAQAAYYRDVEALQEASERAAEDAAREAAKRAADLAARQTAIFEDGEKDRKDIAIAYAAAGASIAGSVGDAFALAQQNMTGLSKKEAAILFRVTQAAQLAQALLLTPAAILQGLAQAGPAGGIAAGIAAGVQVAAIAAAKPPSFRQGTSGYFGAPAGEKAITAHVGEGEGLAVVSRQGMANSRAEGVDARNAGLSGSASGPLSVNLTMSGRVVGRVLIDASRGASGRSAVQAAAKSSFTNPYRRAA